MRLVLGARDFRVLLAARLASQFAEGAFLASVVNLVVFSPEKQGTVRGFAIATMITLLPFSLLEPVAGVFVDRWSRRPILVVLPLVRVAASLLVLPGLGAVVAVYAGTFIVFSANRIFTATTAAVIPRVVGRQDDALLFNANMVAAVVGSVALFGGVLAGGLAAGAAGTPAVLVLTSVAWAASALVSARFSDPLPPEGPPAAALRSQLVTTVAELGAGFRRIGRTPAALAPILTVGVGQFLQVLVIAAALVVIREGLGAGMLTFSALVGAGGVGVFAGFLTAGFLRSRLPNELLIAVAFVVAAVAVIPAAVVALNAVTLTVGAVLLGASYGWTRVPVDTLAQRAVPDNYRGRVFTTIDLAFSTARVLAALAAVAVVPLLGPRTTFVVMGILFLLWAPVVPLWLRRLNGR